MEFRRDWRAGNSVPRSAIGCAPLLKRCGDGGLGERYSTDRAGLQAGLESRPCHLHIGLAADCAKGEDVRFAPSVSRGQGVHVPQQDVWQSRRSWTTGSARYRVVTCQAWEQAVQLRSMSISAPGSAAARATEMFSRTSRGRWEGCDRFTGHGCFYDAAFGKYRRGLLRPDTCADGAEVAAVGKAQAKRYGPSSSVRVDEVAAGIVDALQISGGKVVLQWFIAGRALREGVECGTKEALVDLKQARVASSDAQTCELVVRTRMESTQKAAGGRGRPDVGRRRAPKARSAPSLMECVSSRASGARNREARLRGLGNTGVSLPSLVFELYMLDGDRVGVRVEIRKGLILGDPAPVNLIGERELTGFVVELDDDVFAEVLLETPRLPGQHHSSRLCWPIARSRCRGSRRVRA